MQCSLFIFITYRAFPPVLLILFERYHSLSYKYVQDTWCDSIGILFQCGTPSMASSGLITFDFLLLPMYGGRSENHANMLMQRCFYNLICFIQFTSSSTVWQHLVWFCSIYLFHCIWEEKIRSKNMIQSCCSYGLIHTTSSTVWQKRPSNHHPCYNSAFPVWFDSVACFVPSTAW